MSGGPGDLYIEFLILYTCVFLVRIQTCVGEHYKPNPGNLNANKPPAVGRARGNVNPIATKPSSSASASTRARAGLTLNILCVRVLTLTRAYFMVKFVLFICPRKP